MAAESNARSLEDSEISIRMDLEGLEEIFHEHEELFAKGLTLKQAVYYYGETRKALKAKVEDGTIPAIRLPEEQGKKWRVFPDGVPEQLLHMVPKKLRKKSQEDQNEEIEEIEKDKEIAIPIEEIDPAEVLPILHLVAELEAVKPVATVIELEAGEPPALPVVVPIAHPLEAEPVVADLAVSDPVVADLAVSDQVVADLAVSDQVADLAVSDPVVADLAVSDQVVADLAVAEPVMADPIAPELVANAIGTSDQVMFDPVVDRVVAALMAPKVPAGAEPILENIVPLAQENLVASQESYEYQPELEPYPPMPEIDFELPSAEQAQYLASAMDLVRSAFFLDDAALKSWSPHLANSPELSFAPHSDFELFAQMPVPEGTTAPVIIEEDQTAARYALLQERLDSVEDLLAKSLMRNDYLETKVQCLEDQIKFLTQSHYHSRGFNKLLLLIPAAALLAAIFFFRFGTFVNPLP